MIIFNATVVVFTTAKDLFNHKTLILNLLMLLTLMLKPVSNPSECPVSEWPVSCIFYFRAFACRSNVWPNASIWMRDELRSKVWHAGPLSVIHWTMYYCFPGVSNHASRWYHPCTPVPVSRHDLARPNFSGSAPLTLTLWCHQSLLKPLYVFGAVDWSAQLADGTEVITQIDDHAVLFLRLVLGVWSGLGLGLVLGIGIHCLRSEVDRLCTSLDRA